MRSVSRLVSVPAWCAAALVVRAAVPAPADPPASPAPAADRLAGAYAGLRLQDLPSGRGTIVTWILPGPLEGQGLVSPTVCRPDVVLAVNGKPMNAREWDLFLEEAQPGSTVTLVYRVAPNRGAGIPDQADPSGEIRTVEFTLDERDAWTGTVGRPRLLSARMVYDGAAILEPTDPTNVLGAAMETGGQRARVDRLLSFLSTWPLLESDTHELPLVQAGFLDPFRLPDIAERVIAPSRGVASAPTHVAAEMAAECLAAPPREAIEQGSYTVREPSHAVFAVDFLLNEPRLMVQDALAGLGLEDDAARSAFAAKCIELLRTPGRTFLIQDHPRDRIEVIRRSIGVDFERLLAPLWHCDVDLRFEIDWSAVERESIPAELAGAVEGEIVAAEKVPELGWIVVGWTGPNRYDMARIAGVLDPGGDDLYEASGPRLGVRGIVDLAGNDVYRGTDDQGPGAALLGFSYIDDRAGDDRYEGALLSAGAAMFGTSLLLDRAGNDVYVGREWSVGAAMYGAAIVMDLAGDDRYEGMLLCEGVGGPRGFGALVDAAGRDLYRANGPQPSAYGTPAVFESFSQGVGFGYRQYAAGGIGLLSDLAGDDRYEAGEFAQGGAYYHALGVLHDGAGRDLYYGNRYGQGFGAHQALGALVDESGDDTYWSMTAASQGAAWDMSVGLLFDLAGNDSYQADGLAQGAAANQAIAMLIDGGGDDRYSAVGTAVQGQGSGNGYHYGKSSAFSYSVLLDRGGRDWYSSGRPNDAVTYTGSYNDADPKQSDLDGVAIDEGG
ncbi:MAG: hypothetical protein KDA22_13940 [Phycisphaerales bacterium]|nr:hypothetical protein [Phycisphaerales bacterium]